MTTDTSTDDRLWKVRQPQLWVIACWREPLTDDTAPILLGPPDALLGPFTAYQAERVAAALTCQHSLAPLVPSPPSWAVPPEPER